MPCRVTCPMTYGARSRNCHLAILTVTKILSVTNIGHRGFSRLNNILLLLQICRQFNRFRFAVVDSPRPVTCVRRESHRKRSDRVRRNVYDIFDTGHSYGQIHGGTQSATLRDQRDEAEVCFGYVVLVVCVIRKVKFYRRLYFRAYTKTKT